MRFFYIPYIVFCIILITQFIINVSYKPKINTTVIEQNTDIDEQQEFITSDIIDKEFFVLKAKDNKVYLYDKNNEILEILNIEYSNLREYDKNQFVNGIKVDNMQEVYSLIEDFSN